MLKLALSISLLFAALASLITPETVVAKWPDFITTRINEQSVAEITALLCVILTVWLLSGKKKFSSSILTGIFILLTIVVNITYVSFVFSILPLFFISIALSLRYYPRIRVVVQTKVTPLTKISDIEHSPDNQAADVTDLGVVESDTHIEHDQHLFISKQ